jgi:hypothetical protein
MPDMSAGPLYVAGIVQVPVGPAPPPPVVMPPPPAPVVVIAEPPSPVVEPPVVVPIWSPPAPEVSPPVSSGDPLLLLLPQATKEPQTTQPQKDRNFMVNLGVSG